MPSTALMEALLNGDRTQVDSLPIAGKLLLFQWLVSGLTADIGNLGSLLAPLQAATGFTSDYSGGHYQTTTEPGNETVRSMGDRFRRGLNIPPETPVEDGA